MSQPRTNWKCRVTTLQTLFADIIEYDAYLGYDHMKSQWLAMHIYDGGTKWKKFRADTPEAAVSALKAWWDEYVNGGA